MAVNTETSRSRCPRWASRSPRAPSSSGTSRRATPIEADETLVEISTDKVDAEVPSPATGTLVKVARRRGRHRRGRRACSPRSPPATAPRPPRPRGARRRATAEAPPRPRPTRRRRRRRRGRGATAQIIDIVTPQAGESVTEGTILEWAKQVGDAVEADETVVEISTDKVDMELPAPAAGTITEILAAGGRHRHRRPGHRAHAGRAPAPPSAAPERPRPTAPRPAAARPRPPRRRPRRREASPPSPAASPPPRASTSRASQGTRPRRAHHQGRRARRRANGGAAAPPPAASAQARRRPAHQGRRGDARPLHGREPVDPDRDLVPHDHRHRRWTAGARSSRPPARRSPSPT